MVILESYPQFALDTMHTTAYNENINIQTMLDIELLEAAKKLKEKQKLAALKTNQILTKEKRSIAAKKGWYKRKIAPCCDKVSVPSLNG